MVYYDAGTNRYYNLNAGYDTVLGENDPMSIPAVSGNLPLNPNPNPSGRTVLVPGYMAGVEAGKLRVRCG